MIYFALSCVIYNIFFGIDCCLDVEWLSEDTFASAGADMRIFIMQIDKDEHIKTLKSVSVFDFIQSRLIGWLADTKMKLIRLK